MIRKIWSRDFVLLTISNFLMCITYYAVISTLPIYLASELHAGKSDVGIVLSVYTIASVMIRPFSGFGLDRFGRRTIFLSALVLYTILFAGYLVATTITFLIVLRFAQGLTWGVTTISGSTIAVDITPAEKRGEGIGYFSLSTTLGMAVGPVIGLFICHHMGYPAMFIAALILSTASFICASMIRLQRKALLHNAELNLNSLFDINAIIPSLNLLIIMITYGGLISFIALYGREIGVQNTSLFFLIFAIGIATSRFTAGKAFDKNGPKNLLTFCLCLLTSGFPFLALLKNEWGYYGSALFIGFGIGVVFPTFQAMVNNIAEPGHRGAANSTLYTGLDLGMGLGMIMMGFVSEHLSITVSFLFSAIICLIGLGFFRQTVADHYERHKKIP
jgi:MFS family permease